MSDSQPEIKLRFFIQKRDGELTESTPRFPLSSSVEKSEPLVERIVFGAAHLRQLEEQEIGVKNALSRLLAQFRECLRYGSQSEQKQLRARLKALYVELDRITGLQERARNYVSGVTIQRQINPPKPFALRIYQGLKRLAIDSVRWLE